MRRGGDTQKSDSLPADLPNHADMSTPRQVSEGEGPKMKGREGYLLLEFQLEGSAVLLELPFPLGSFLSCQLQPQLSVCLQGADVVLVLIQQMLHLLLVHLQNECHQVRIFIATQASDHVLVLLQQVLGLLLVHL